MVDRVMFYGYLIKALCYCTDLFLLWPDHTTWCQEWFYTDHDVFSSILPENFDLSRQEHWPQ